MSEVYFDVSDLYYRVKKVFNKKVNYKLLIEKLSEKFGEVTRGEAFGCQDGNEAQGFITHLRSANIVVHYRRPKTFHVNEQKIKTCNWNVDITILSLCSEEYNKVKVRAIKILQILYINNVPRPHIIKDLPIKFIWETKSSCSYIEIYGDKYYVAYKDEMGGIRKEESDINILLKHVRAVYEKDNSA